MKNACNLTVLEGGYGRKLHRAYDFISARATDTRSMGVVGMHVIWEKPDGVRLHELYHLDFESYGVDGYGCYAPSEDGFLEAQIKIMMGGLGGTLVPIGIKAVRLLLQSAVAVAPDCLLAYPELKVAFPHIDGPAACGDEAYDEICRRLTPRVTHSGAIHHFMMRTVGRDWSGRRWMWSAPEKNQGFREMAPVPSTLLRETIEVLDDGSCQVVSLLDHFGGYNMVVSILKVTSVARGPLIESAEMVKRMKISSIEASMMLRKKAFISVYAVRDATIEMVLEERYPEMLGNEHEAGVLYSRFKDNNDHVQAAVFHLSDDILGLYYITDAGQMLVGSFSAENLERIERELLDWADEKRIERAGQFVIDSLLLYDFVNSGYDDFLEFLDWDE